MIKPTFYWHDYETWGVDPRRDRPAQFAGVRTDWELNIIGEPLMCYCRPSDDVLPQPDACLVTGITPQKAEREGLCEAEFIARIHAELAAPGTCGVGYNSIRFDDEVTRFALYRNLYDPYAREWKSGNSRWDIIDMVRLTRALRPEGIEWPEREEGVPSFRLEELTVANGIAHAAAHDALSDVHATIAMARLIRKHQPRLYNFVLEHRTKQAAARLLDLNAQQPVLHVSGMFPARFGSIAMVAPVARHPTNQNGLIVYDLRYDPEPLLTLEAEEVRRRVFTAANDLKEGEERIPLKTVHLNKCPVLVPMNTLTPEAAERWEIDVAQGWAHLERIQAARGLALKIQEVHRQREFDEAGDPDLNLYGEGFFSDEDRRRMEEAHRLSPAELGSFHPRFDDPRLPEMLFRYRARNWPETLTGEELARWNAFRQRRLNDQDGGGSITLERYRQRLAALRVERGDDAAALAIVEQLAEWGDRVAV